MRKTIIFLFFMFLFIGFVYSAPTDEQIRQAAATLGIPFADLKTFIQSYQAKSAPDGTIPITAKDLYDAYKESEIKADSLYINKILKITGKVGGVEKDSGNYIVSLDGDGKGNFDSYISVYIKSSELTKAANLEKGQIITVIGTCVGYVGGFFYETVTIRNATISM